MFIHINLAEEVEFQLFSEDELQSFSNLAHDNSGESFLFLQKL